MWHSLTGNVLDHMMFKKGKTFFFYGENKLMKRVPIILIPFMKPELIFPFLTQLRALSVCGGSITCQGTD